MLKYGICRKSKYHTSVEVLEKEDQDIDESWITDMALQLHFEDHFHFRFDPKSYS